MTTFYIASSSLPAQRERVRKLATDLKMMFGWEWCNNWDWTQGFDAAKNSGDLAKLLRRAMNDLISARDCDVFIFLEVDVPSLGANREYGIRWGDQADIYRVSKRKEHLFDMVGFVYSFETEEELLKLFGAHQ